MSGDGGSFFGGGGAGTVPPKFGQFTNSGKTRAKFVQNSGIFLPNIRATFFIYLLFGLSKYVVGNV